VENGWPWVWGLGGGEEARKKIGLKNEEGGKRTGKEKTREERGKTVRRR